MTDADEFLTALRAQVGATGAALSAPDPVNVAMIRRWCEAMDDTNPNHVDPERAAAGRHGGIVAPPTMLNVWNMQGLAATREGRRRPDDPQAGVSTRLEEAGFVGIVATDCEHTYHRYLRPGDHLSATPALVDVSSEKQTALGVGHFVTTETTYRDQHGELVGSMRFRVLRFRPGTGRVRPAAPTDGDGRRPERPYPSRNMIQEFFWEGAARHELRIQRCIACGTLHHPPLVRCNRCGSIELDHVVASGRATLYSHAVPHYPQVPSFDYPLVVGLVELEEGTRLVTNITGVTPDELEIGMPLELHWLDAGEGVTLPQFRPARLAPRTTTMASSEARVGMGVPPCPVPITTGLIVTTAIASNDFQAVHHDREAAVRGGADDIYMNILATGGITGRWLTDWAGPDAVLRELRIRLGAPNHPGDTMTLAGTVSASRTVGDDQVVTVEFRGRNSRGTHVQGSADLSLRTDTPGADQGS